MPDQRLTDELRNRFAYHRPSTMAVQEQHQDWRNACALLASIATELVPAGRERSLVMTQIEQAMFWGNAAIARTQGSESRIDEESTHDPQS